MGPCCRKTQIPLTRARSNRLSTGVSLYGHTGAIIARSIANGPPMNATPQSPTSPSDDLAAYVIGVRDALLHEAMALLGEGVAPDAIESAAGSLGMAEPPLAMIDALSLTYFDQILHAQSGGGQGHGHDHAHAHDHPHDHAHGHDHPHGHDHDHDHDHEHEHEHEYELEHGHEETHGQRSRPVGAGSMPDSAIYVLEKMAHGFERFGATSGYGFYDHDEDGSRELWEGLSVFARGARAIPQDDVRDRLLYIQFVTAARVRAELKIGRSDADAASIAGWGFPAVSNGVLSHLEAIGVQSVVARAARLAEQYGERFTPPDSGTFSHT